MSITKKFKMINVILIIGILCVLIVGDIPENIYSKVNIVLYEYREIKSIYNSMTLNFQMKDYYKKRRDKLQEDLNSLNVVVQLHQEQIISLINYHSVKNSIELNNINFTDDSLNYSDDPEQIDKTTNSFVVYVTIEFISNLDRMISFVDDIRSQNSYIAIPSISVLSLDENLVKVSVCINFYLINKDLQEVIV